MPERRPEPRYLAVGRVLRPHGVRGELRMELLTDYPERLAALKTLHVGEGHIPYRLSAVRLHQGIALIKFEGVDDRNTAETLRGATVEVALEDAIPLEEGEYYHYQLVGLPVVTDAGERLGEVVEVLQSPGANDVYVVHGPHGEVLIPAIAEVILDLDVQAGSITVRLLPGLLRPD